MSEHFGEIASDRQTAQTTGREIHNGMTQRILKTHLQGIQIHNHTNIQSHKIFTEEDLENRRRILDLRRKCVEAQMIMFASIYQAASDGVCSANFPLHD